MSKEVYQWFQTASSNGFAGDGGMPEGMARSLVNNEARERMRALREFYEDPTWLRLVKNEFTKVRDSATDFHVLHTAGPAEDATSKFPVGCRLRFTDDDIVFTYGFVDTVAFNTPNTDVTMKMDSGDTIPAGLTDIATHVSRDTREAAFVDTGTDADEVPLNSDLGTAAYKTEGAGGTIDADLVDGLHAAGIIAQAVNAPNMVLNPGPSVWQRGVNFTAATAGNWKNDDDTVLADGWGLLSDGDDRIDVAQETSDLPAGASSVILATGATIPSNQKFGFVHVLENVDARKLEGQVVSFSCYVKSANLTDVRMGIFTWTGGADLATMDLVGTWNAQKTDPTPAASWALLSAASDKTVTASWTQIHITGTMPASVVNAAVFVWSESNFATGNILRIGAFDFYFGSAVRAFREPDFASELVKAQRRFWKSFAYATAPAQNVSADPISENDPGEQRVNMHFPAAMWDAPAAQLQLYNPLAANGNWSDGTVPASNTLTPRKVIIGATASPAAASTTIHATVEQRFN